LSLGGVAQALASHLHWLSRDASCIQFKMDPEFASLMGDQQIARLEAALSEVESTPLKIEISVGEVDGASPAQIASHRKARALANAKADLERDQRVQALVANFGATIVEGSVRPKVNEGDR
jgi:DNA polymerase-3 subunit gamma/tau